MTTISIALCTYNGARFLQEQLDSFRAQTRQPDELVVFDDSSQDATAEIIEKFSRDAPFPVTLHVNPETLGSTRNFESAISACTGDIIFLSDQDDVWLPHKIERIAAEFAKDAGAALVFSDAEIVDENLAPLRPHLLSRAIAGADSRGVKERSSFEELLLQNVVTGATTAFAAKCRNAILPFPAGIPNLLHDAWIALAIANDAELVFIDEPLMKYRQHGRQQLGVFVPDPGMSWDDRDRQFEKSIEFLNDEIARLTAMGDVIETRPQFEKRRSSISIERLTAIKRDMIAHYDARKSLPRSRAARLLPVLRELATGRYTRFSRGYLSAIKDVVTK